MKTLFLILFPLSLLAQSHNEMIWNFANDHIGKKVGKGECGDLVKEAYRQFSDEKLINHILFKGYEINFGTEVPKDSIIPGDVVWFRYFENGKETYGHVAIVYAISETNMTVIQQNYEEKKEVTIQVWKDQVALPEGMTQEIRFYRPY